VKSLNTNVVLLKGFGGAGGTYGETPLVGSEICKEGGGALRPSRTADEGTPGELVPADSVGLIATLPIAKVSRRQRDAITVGIFIGGRSFSLRVPFKGNDVPGGRDRLARRHQRQRLFTRSRSQT
jgi:hypothetical protein